MEIFRAFEIGAYGFTDSGDYNSAYALFAYLFAAPSSPTIFTKKMFRQFSLSMSPVRWLRVYFTFCPRMGLPNLPCGFFAHRPAILQHGSLNPAPNLAQGREWEMEGRKALDHFRGPSLAPT